jgi:hypothetical protein
MEGIAALGTSELQSCFATILDAIEKLGLAQLQAKKHSELRVTFQGAIKWVLPV